MCCLVRLMNLEIKQNELIRLEQAYQQIRGRILNKPKVSKEFVEKWNQIIAERVNVYNIEHFGEVNNLGLVYPGTENLKEMLQEAGVEVEE